MTSFRPCIIRQVLLHAENIGVVRGFQGVVFVYAGRNRLRSGRRRREAGGGMRNGPLCNVRTSYGRHTTWIQMNISQVISS